MLTTAKEVRAENERRSGLLQEIRDAIAKRQAITPGLPSISIPLDKVYSFQKDGEICAVMPIQEVLYLVDEILRG